MTEVMRPKRRVMLVFEDFEAGEGAVYFKFSMEAEDLNRFDGEDLDPCEIFAGECYQLCREHLAKRGVIQDVSLMTPVGPKQ